MKQLIHTITLSVFEKNMENLDTIQEKLQAFLPIDFEEEKFEIQRSSVNGMDQKKIHIFTLLTKKQRHHWLLLQHLFDHLQSKDITLLYHQRESRLDDEGHFFIRIDKKSLFDGKYIVTEGGDCFHFKIKLAAFPAKRSQFLLSLKEVFEQLGYVVEED